MLIEASTKPNEIVMDYSKVVGELSTTSNSFFSFIFFQSSKSSLPFSSFIIFSLQVPLSMLAKMCSIAF